MSYSVDVDIQVTSGACVLENALTVKIPIMVNCTAIKEGTQLLLCAEPPHKKAKSSKK